MEKDKEELREYIKCLQIPEEDIKSLLELLDHVPSSHFDAFATLVMDVPTGKRGQFAGIRIEYIEKFVSDASAYQYSINLLIEEVIRKSNLSPEQEKRLEEVVKVVPEEKFETLEFLITKTPLIKENHLDKWIHDIRTFILLGAEPVT